MIVPTFGQISAAKSANWSLSLAGSTGNGPRHTTSSSLSSCRSDSATIRLSDLAACRGRSIARYKIGRSIFVTGSPRKSPARNPIL
jgi:hypothetical protein